jgi:hypothetical protein
MSSADSNRVAAGASKMQPVVSARNFGIYILKMSPGGTMSALDQNAVWTTNLKQAHAFPRTYGTLVAKSDPEAFTSDQHPAPDIPLKARG